MEFVQWTGIFVFVFGAIVGLTGIVLAECMDLSSYVPDAFLKTAQITIWAGAGMAIIGMVGSAS